MTEDTYTGPNCCAECTCTDPHSSTPETDVSYSEGFATTETPTNCCEGCRCTNSHQSKPPVME